MSATRSVIPGLISERGDKVADNIFAIVAGSLFVAALAQVSIPLPFTPVPITGQTLGMLLLALGWGAKRATASFALYIAEGFVGLPVFANGKAFVMGPTFGYLLGMLIACWVVGSLADRGFTKKFSTSVFAAIVGTIIVYACGLGVLAFYVPRAALLEAGLWPFLIGDAFKVVFAASFATILTSRVKF